jgi:hypothetical protein
MTESTDTMDQAVNSVNSDNFLNGYGMVFDKGCLDMIATKLSDDSDIFLKPGGVHD